MFNQYESNSQMLVYELEPGEEPDALSAAMLRNRPLSGFLPVGLPFPEEGEPALTPGVPLRMLVPVAGKEPLPAYLGRERSAEELQQLLSRLASAILAARAELKNTMMPLQEWLLDPRFTYVEPDSGEILFLCIPSERVACLQNNLLDFLRLTAAYAIRDEISCSAPALSLLARCNQDSADEEALLKELAELPRWDASPASKEPKKRNHSFRKKLALLWNAPAPAAADPFEAEFALEAGPADLGTVPVLTCRRTGKDYVLQKGSTVLGRDPARTDICLSGDPDIAPEHARIFFFQGTYFLEDLNSDAGTWLNSTKLTCLKEERLSAADVIRIGKEELIFSLQSMGQDSLF